MPISDLTAVLDRDVFLSWSDVSGADGYRVYRAQASGSSKSDYTQIADITPPGYLDTNVEDGEQYFYRVTSYTEDPAFFEVTISSTNSPVQPGNTLDVTADVTNTGNNSAQQTVTLDINNGVGQADSVLLELAGGSSTTQTLSWAVPSGQTEQDYQATVASADDSTSQTVTVKSGPTVGSSVSRAPDNNTTTKTGLRGLAVNPNTALAGVRVELSSNQGTISRLQVYDDANGTVLAQKTGSFSAGDVVDFTGISLSSGTSYSLLGDDQGSNYTLGFDSGNISTQTSADIDIVNARKGQAVAANNASVIVTVTALL